jgi:16S rRNA (cytosine1402-N4)-methyltransferase
MMLYHKPVLLDECINGLQIKPEGIYVDCTFGGGGHSREILKHLKKGKLIAFDQDPEAKKNIQEDARFIFVESNFRFLKNFLRYHEISNVDGILADLGVSWHHFDSPERGFSIRFDGNLDMRMNQNAELTAEIIINEYPLTKLDKIFREYAEVHNAHLLAKTIASERDKVRINRVFQFIEIISSCIPRKNNNQYLAQVFQALRIEVNQELMHLKEMLLQTIEVLQAGGRLAIITYHSLEDKIVKNFMKTGNFEGKQEKDFYGNLIAPLTLLNNKVITPSDQELDDNNRSRSAKLRIAIRN